MAGVWAFGLVNTQNSSSLYHLHFSTLNILRSQRKTIQNTLIYFKEIQNKLGTSGTKTITKINEKKFQITIFKKGT